MKIEVKKFVTEDLNTFKDTYEQAEVIIVSSEYDIIRDPQEIGQVDVGVDLYNLEEFTMLGTEKSRLIKTGVKTACIPSLHFEVRPRSSLGLKTPLRLSNSIGTIDPEYRGDIGMIFDNVSDTKYHVEKGTRLCQLCLIPYIPMLSTNYIWNYNGLTIHYYLSKNIYNNFQDMLPSSRGVGGFGSTGTR